jgi:hypothetical protein
LSLAKINTSMHILHGRMAKLTLDTENERVVNLLQLEGKSGVLALN